MAIDLEGKPEGFPFAVSFYNETINFINKSKGDSYEHC